MACLGNGEWRELMLKQVEVGRGGGSEASLASRLNSNSACGALLGGNSSRKRSWH